MLTRPHPKAKSKAILQGQGHNPQAKAKATYLKAENTTTFPQHLYRTINVLRIKSSIRTALSLTLTRYMIALMLLHINQMPN